MWQSVLLLCSFTWVFVEVTSLKTDANGLVNDCKNLTGPVELCSSGNLNGSTLRVECTVLNLPLGENLKMFFKEQNPRDTQYHRLGKSCEYTSTEVAHYVCLLTVNVSQFAPGTEIYCKTVYEKAQIQEKRVYINDEASPTPPSTERPKYLVTRPAPLINCTGKTGYYMLAWNIAQNLNVTYLTPGQELRAFCVLGCHTQVPPGKWKLVWTLNRKFQGSDRVLNHQDILDTRVVNLTLAYNFTQDYDDTTLECSFRTDTPPDVKASKVTRLVVKTLFPVSRNDDETIGMETTEGTNLTDSDSLTRNATAPPLATPEEVNYVVVGVASAAGLLVAALAGLCCRLCGGRRAKAPGSGDRRPADSKDSGQGAAGVVYAELELADPKVSFKRTETIKYAEIIGIVKSA